MGKSSELKEELVGLIRAFKEGACAFARALGCGGNSPHPLPGFSPEPGWHTTLAQEKEKNATLATEVDNLRRKLKTAEDQQRTHEARLHQLKQELEQEQQRHRASKAELSEVQRRCISLKNLDPRLEQVLTALSTCQDPACQDLARRLRVKREDNLAMQAMQLAKASTDKNLIKSALEGLDALPKERTQALGKSLIPLLVEWHNAFVTNDKLHLTLQTTVPQSRFDASQHRRLPGTRGERIVSVLLPGLSGPGLDVKPLVEVGE